MPSRIEVMSARSATDNSAKYSCSISDPQSSASRSSSSTTSSMELHMHRGDYTYITLNRLVVVMNRLELKRSIRAVDLVDELRDFGSERGRVTRTRGSHLNESNLAHPFRVIMKEAFECAQLLTGTDRGSANAVFTVSTTKTHLGENTFSRIKLVAANDDLLARVNATQCLDLWSDAGRFTEDMTLMQKSDTVTLEESKTTHRSTSTFSTSIPIGKCAMRVMLPLASTPPLPAS